MSGRLELVDIDPLPTVGLSAVLTRSQTENFSIISKLWMRFNAQIHNIGNHSQQVSDWEKFGITYSENQEYRYLAAIPYRHHMIIPRSMQNKAIVRGRYARFTHRGELTALKFTVNDIYKKILPAANITPEPDGKTGLVQFERYDKKFHWNRADSIIEIYVLLKTDALNS